MTSSEDDEPTWEPDPRFPPEPEFYRRVLHFMPTPLLVANVQGEIVYCNQALLQLGGWDLEPGADRNMMNYVHPDDREWLIKAFIETAESPVARVLSGRQWGDISFRLLTADGTALPIDLVGNGGTLDPAVGGIIYEIRPARTRLLLGRVLAGLSQGASIHHLLSLVAEMIASPPLDLQAVILQSARGGGFVTVASTSAALAEIVAGRADDPPWASPVSEPTFIDIAKLPARLAARFRGHGFVDLWHMAVESPLTQDTLRFVIASSTHNVPALGPVNRMLQGQEIAAAVLLRTQADVLLEYAAAYDALTGLPNGAKFHQLAESLDPMIDRGALHVSLDGLKAINEELGKPTGDAALRIAIDRIMVACGDGQIIGRTAGGEFTIILRPPPEAASAMDYSLDVAREILTSVHDPIVVAGRPLTLSSSIGVSAAARGVSTDHLLTWADAAMHDARRSGGRRICRYSEGIG